LEERLGIAGAGTIACGLAVSAARVGEVMLWARSEASAERARETVAKTCARLKDEGIDPERVQIVNSLDQLDEATFLVEAIVEHHESKAELLSDLSDLEGHAGSETIVATTTSSLSITELSQATGSPDRFVGFHVFNPVPRMQLVELAFPEEATEDTRRRAHTLCETLGKTPVEVPDIAGFVVNRLLFPYLFDAVRLQSETGMAAQDIDQCMKLGAGVPMGPLALLDLVGLDVAKSIGEAIGASVPPDLVEMVSAGSLGRKTGQGFYNYG
jgi:3-hydroxybutyryl-CoA dehydrogenase